jgi:hypothetical protein
MPTLEGRASVSMPGLPVRPVSHRRSLVTAIRSGQSGIASLPALSWPFPLAQLRVPRSGWAAIAVRLHTWKAPQLLVTGGVVRSLHRLVVLAEELLALLLGRSLRITSGSAGLPSAVRSRDSSLRTRAVLTLPTAPDRIQGVEAWVRAIRLNARAPRLPLRAHCSLFFW